MSISPLAAALAAATPEAEKAARFAVLEAELAERIALDRLTQVLSRYEVLVVGKHCWCPKRP